MLRRAAFEGLRRGTWIPVAEIVRAAIAAMRRAFALRSRALAMVRRSIVTRNGPCDAARDAQPIPTFVPPTRPFAPTLARSAPPPTPGNDHAPHGNPSLSDHRGSEGGRSPPSAPPGGVEDSDKVMCIGNDG